MVVKKLLHYLRASFLHALYALYLVHEAVSPCFVLFCTVGCF